MLTLITLKDAGRRSAAAGFQGALVMNNVEPFIIGGRLEICGDGFELCICCPGRAGRKVLASVLKLTFAQGIRRVYEMQFMFSIRGFKQLPKPRALRCRVAGKVEHDRNAFCQQRADMSGQSILESGGVLDESWYVSNLARKQPIQELVLHQKNGIFPLGQISRESRFASRHFSAQENQLRWGAQFRLVMPILV